MKDIHPMALFRLSVLGPLISRDHLAHGELSQILRDLSQKDYAIPGSQRCRIGEKTIEEWYYRWRREGVDGLAPRSRADQGVSKISESAQDLILKAKRDNPKRSIQQILEILERSGTIPKGSISRSALHRFLQQQGLSRPSGSESLPEEYRRFEAMHANQIWYGDVMHGPKALFRGRVRKAYLVSLMDDASRLITHSAFCAGETALDIEGVLKQAILRRGLPRKLIVDQGAAYRSRTLQAICARLDIRLIYCRPYAPEGKGKLERFHRTLRAGFLSELDPGRMLSVEDLNARLWSWLAQIYHTRPHAGLEGRTPLERYQQDLPKIRQLGEKAVLIDAIFQHRVQRKVRKDGTLSFEGRFFEVPFELSGKTICLLIDPHSGTILGIEDDQGKSLGMATPLNAIANLDRPRRKPKDKVTRAPAAPSREALNLVEMVHQQHYRIQE